MAIKYIYRAVILSSFLLTGCIGQIWTGASTVYNRHSLYKHLSDFQLSANASRAIYKDKTFKRSDCIIDIAVLNGDILLAGHVPTAALKAEAIGRVRSLHEYRRLFNQISVGPSNDNRLRDDWITTKLRSKIIANSNLDPNSFKVVTSDFIVYLMGDVHPDQARKVIYMARTCAGVKRVVTLFKYYHLSDQLN